MLLHSDAVNEYNECIKSNTSIVNDNNCSQACIIDISVIERCIKLLKLNKDADYDGIVSEHIIYSHPCIVVHLKLLFNMMLSHGYVPDAFSFGIVIPIVKDKRGDLSSVDNYRPITLSPIISKIFEYMLIDKYSSYFISDDLQFCFKQKLGCSNIKYLYCDK